MIQLQGRRVAVTIAVASLLALAGCAGDASDEVASDEPVTTSTTTEPTTREPGTTTSVLPPCSEVPIGAVQLTPAEWLPVDVPDDWRLEAAATVRPSNPVPTFEHTYLFVEDEQVTGKVAVGTGPMTLADGEPVTVRGTQGVWGHLGGRSIGAAHPYLTWREGGVDLWVSAAGLEAAQVVDALDQVELSAEPLRIEDPTGRLVLAGERPAGSPSTIVVLTYEVPGGTARGLFGSGPDGATTDRVQVLVEQFAQGGSGVLVTDVSGSLGTALGWSYDASGATPVLRSGADAPEPVVSSASQVRGADGVAVAASVTGAPPAADATGVLAQVEAVAPSDERLASARVDVGEPGQARFPACVPG